MVPYIEHSTWPCLSFTLGSYCFLSGGVGHLFVIAGSQFFCPLVHLAKTSAPACWPMQKNWPSHWAREKILQPPWRKNPLLREKFLPPSLDS